MMVIDESKIYLETKFSSVLFFSTKRSFDKLFSLTFYIYINVVYICTVWIIKLLSQWGSVFTPRLQRSVRWSKMRNWGLLCHATEI